MRDIIKADVTALPKFTTTAGDPFWADVLAYVNEFDLDALDTAQDIRMARINLAAHILSKTANAAGGAAGPVTSVAAGGVRRSFGLVAQAASMGSLATTQYGQEFLDIVGGSMCAGPFVI